MSNNLAYIKLKEELSLSDYFGAHYSSILKNENESFANTLIADVAQIYNGMIYEYSTLTDFQKLVLANIFEQFNKIRDLIDPNRLGKFSHSKNDDDDIVLARNTQGGRNYEPGLFSIIIHDDETFAFSFIGNSDQNILNFHNEEADFEKIVLDFFI